MYKRFYRKKKLPARETKTTVEFSCTPRQLDHYVGILIPNKIVKQLSLSTKRKWKIAVSKNKLTLDGAAIRKTPSRNTFWKKTPWANVRSARHGGYFSRRQ